MKNAALITGGARRIGKEIALFLSSIGFDIAIHYNSSYEEAKIVKKEIEKKNKCSIFKAELENENELLSLIKEVKQHFNNFNLLINNASVFKRASFKESSLELFKKNFNINFKAPYFLIRDFAKICTSGHVINIIDSKISKNDISYSAYTLSKMALYNLSQISAKELAPNIRVNGIAPGYILAPDKESENYLVQRPDKIPLKRKGNISEINSSIKFLLENSFITGQVIFVDGGEHL